MEITVRKASSYDLPTIIDLVKEFARFLNKENEVKTTLIDFEKNKKITGCLVAETQGKQIIGYVFYCFVFHTWTGRAAYIDDIYVNKEYRRSGVGLKLMTTMIDIAKDNECNSIKWQVLKSNQNAIDFYEKFGAQMDDNNMDCTYSVVK